MRSRALTLAALVAAVLGVGVAAAPAPALAQEPDPGAQPPPPGPPSPPSLVLSGRSVRMSRAGFVSVRLGCRATGAAQAGDACIGSMTLRLANTITLEYLPPKAKKPVIRRIFPFNFAVGDFTLGVGEAVALRVRLSPRAQALVRSQERLRVDVIVSYNNRAGTAGSARRNVRFYFPASPGA
ncbi:MAG: hypothetical protein QOJ97_717 [Solirubrobacteraceae bacterium]|jgi:hypothetical protein|nr:hypothetical protein [Solirubrobacteraceae bacterium]